MLFRILLGIDLLATAATLFFFVMGLGDGSVSQFNILLWMGLLGGIAAVIVGAVVLHRKGNARMAISLLLVLAVPASMLAQFYLMLLVINPRWN